MMIIQQTDTQIIFYTFIHLVIILINIHHTRSNNRSTTNMQVTLINFIFSALAATSIAAPVPEPAADPQGSLNGPSYSNTPPSSYFPQAAPPLKPAGITLSGPAGTSSFGSDGSFALSSANSPFGVAYTPGRPEPPRGRGWLKTVEVADAPAPAVEN
jgi:hypothetical protein